jgi:hypothetical protein
LQILPSKGSRAGTLGVSIFVPYLPMTPIQILTNNLLYDVSQAIPTDIVDPEQIALSHHSLFGVTAALLAARSSSSPAVTGVSRVGAAIAPSARSTARRRPRLAAGQSRGCVSIIVPVT